MATPFSQSPRYTQIAMAVKPEGMIADIVCPRVPVDSDKFIYTKADHLDYFTLPDSNVGRTSQPNRVEFGATDVTESVTDQALDDFVPNRDIKSAANSGGNYDPLTTAVEGIAVLLNMAREKRVADLYFNSATYATDLRTSLSDTDMWDNTASDPVDQLLAMFESMIVKPNLGIFGRRAWRRFRTHPKVVAMALNKGMAIAGGSEAAGILSQQQVAELLELKNIVIGETLFNAAKKGQPAAMQGLWTPTSAAFQRIDTNVRNVRNMAMPTFGFTAQWGTLFSGTIADATTGIEGGQLVRVGEYVKELVSFQEAGCLFQNTVA